MHLLWPLFTEAVDNERHANAPDCRELRYSAILDCCTGTRKRRLTQERPVFLMSHSVSSALGVRQHWAASDVLKSFAQAGSSGCSRRSRAAARRRSATPAFASLHCSDPIRSWPLCRSTAATVVVSCVAKCLPVVNPDRGPASVRLPSCFRHNTTTRLPRHVVCTAKKFPELSNHPSNWALKEPLL
ncbi:hypothetical protein CCMA1212_007918 [Trichoderma ghanense]|uniref:Uncharacterized protein n=1 Tax=Trichoderma ghanense TaxID=65468 RepID=A0ABY2GWT8_9HYPO